MRCVDGAAMQRENETTVCCRLAGSWVAFVYTQPHTHTQMGQALRTASLCVTRHMQWIVAPNPCTTPLLDPAI